MNHPNTVHPSVLYSIPVPTLLIVWYCSLDAHRRLIDSLPTARLCPLVHGAADDWSLPLSRVSPVSLSGLTQPRGQSSGHPVSGRTPGGSRTDGARRPTHTDIHTGAAVLGQARSGPSLSLVSHPGRQSHWRQVAARFKRTEMKNTNR